jgi:hypothetical protein
MTIAFHNSSMLWDIVGVDGLQAMKTLFGEKVDRIAPFQSLELESCSILRLCEGNFRIAWHGDSVKLDEHIQFAQAQYQIWIKRSNGLSAIVLPESAASKLVKLAVPKPPYRLDPMPLNCAAPSRIDNLSVLVWKHPVLRKPCFELQMALSDQRAIAAKLGT